MLRHPTTAFGVLIAAGLVCGASLAADAPPAVGTARPDPLDARASVPPVTHVSPFQHYRGHRDVQVGSWKDANDTVTRIGGWRVYAREATVPEGAAVPQQPQQQTPRATGGHQH